MRDNIKYYPLSHTRNILQLVLLNKKLEMVEGLLNQIQDISESGEDSDFQIGKINTVILGWIQEKKNDLKENGRLNEPPNSL